MLIKKIEKLKNNKYKIIIDNEKIITYDNVILDNNLLYKKSIDESLYKKIQTDTLYYSVYDKVVKYILKRRRSEKEVKKYLLKYELKEEEVNNIILKLKNNKLINDFAYCKAYINDNIYLGKIGLNKIKNHLIGEDIPICEIEKSLNEIDISILDDKLEKLIIKKINSNKKYSNIYLKQKILNEMINLGYDKEKILLIIENNLFDNNNIIKNEFEKQHIKLSKKYSGEELYKNIKLKLTAKGFNINEINDLIEKKQEN